MNVLTLLPMKPKEFERILEGYCTNLSSKTDFSAEEIELQLTQDFQNWMFTSTGACLPKSTGELLCNVSWFLEIAQELKTTPGSLYRKVVEGVQRTMDVSKREAVVAVSYLPLILNLANSFSYSSAGIAKVINEFDDRVALHWKGIDKIMGCLKLDRSLDKQSVEELLSADRNRSESVWADANESVIIDLLSTNADGLGLDLRESLQTLIAPPDEDVFIPYLQTLTFLCTITEYFDHPCEYLYTFKPRGEVAKLIYDLFPATLAPSGNPVLNNFKAIDRLSFDWSKSRDDNRRQAHALVKTVKALSSLSHSSRRMYARRIREAMIRFIDVKTPKKITLHRASDSEEAIGLLNAVAEHNTNTSGIIEQRVVDFAMAYFHIGNKWRSRGLGDPVNATNSSSKKLGDCDFQDASGFVCEAAEAHGGKLTSVYVEEHLQTMRKNIHDRCNEWELIADLDHWTLNLLFVAHEVSCGEITQGDLPVKLQTEWTTYSDFLKPLTETAGNDAEMVRLFNTWVVDVLNKDNVPNRVKEKFIHLLHQNPAST